MRRWGFRSDFCTIILTTISIFGGQGVRAWGTYGHQQINVGAVDVAEKLLKDDPKWHGVIELLRANTLLLQRLAITPDYDFKVVGTRPDDDKVNRARMDADRYEHPLHFWELDAFGKPESVHFPVGEFSKVLDDLREMLAKNADEIKVIDPSKAIADPRNVTVEDVANHGTNPWRVLQLYDRGVDALRKGDLEMALIWLGEMGHYVGDMSQPFHATMNYDGQYNPDPNALPAAGVHSSFESLIFTQLIGHDADKDENGCFKDFNETKEPVLAAATNALGSHLEPMARADIFPAILQLVREGSSSVPTLLRNYGEAMEKFPAGGDRGGGKCERDLKGVPSVLEFAEKRLGQASALLARIWISAFHDAKVSPESEAYTFDRAKVIENYPIPSYLPEGHQKAPHVKHSHTDEPKASAAAVRYFSGSPME